MSLPSRVLSRVILCAWIGASAVLVAAPSAAGARERGVTPVVVVIGNSTLALSVDSVPAGTVVFRVVNRGKAARDFRIGAGRTSTIAGGRSAILRVSLLSGGPQVYSSLDSHRSGRLSGVLNVVEPCVSPATTTVSVEMAQDRGGLTVSQTTVPCGTVTFVVTNTGTLVDRLDVFEVESAQAKGSTPELAPGQTAKLTLVFPVKGTVYCQSDDYPPPEPEYGGDYNELSQLSII